jgi:hypothetical protein
MLTSAAAGFILLDFPANTKRLTERERELAITRLIADSARNQTEDRPHLGHLGALKEAVKNWRVWVLVVGYMSIVGKFGEC